MIASFTKVSGEPGPGQPELTFAMRAGATQKAIIVYLQRHGDADVSDSSSEGLSDITLSLIGVTLCKDMLAIFVDGGLSRSDLL